MNSKCYWRRWAAWALLGAVLAPPAALSQTQSESSTPRVQITEGVIEPVSIAFHPFLAGTAHARERGERVASVAANDLVGTGLFRRTNPDAFIETITDFSSRPQFEDWRVIRVEWLVTGESEDTADGRIAVRFRLWDITQQRQALGLRYHGSPQSWRRIAHQMADAIYMHITNEGAYFDSRIAFVEETGPKDARRKRLALMDQDGANVSYLTDTGRLSMTPRFSPSKQQLAYISFRSDRAHVYVAEIDSGKTELIGEFEGTSFAPRFSPESDRVVMSIERDGNTDIYIMDLATRERVRLTRHPAIDTSPSFSPDGRRVAFESDRSGTQQIYIMNADGSRIERVSFGEGRYSTPVWSPRGDLLAFTKQHRGLFHIGLMTPEGQYERLLTGSYHDEGPTWAPNGRVLMFFREFPGESLLPKLYTVDVTGRNLREVPTPHGASDPAWSALLD